MGHGLPRAGLGFFAHVGSPVRRGFPCNTANYEVPLVFLGFPPAAECHQSLAEPFPGSEALGFRVGFHGPLGRGKGTSAPRDCGSELFPDLDLCPQETGGPKANMLKDSDGVRSKK